METMENILCFLKSHTESWLNFVLAILDMNPRSIFLGVVGLLLLYLVYLGYLLLKWFSPTLWGMEDHQQRHGRAKKRRRGAFTKGRRPRQRKAEKVEGARKLLSVVKSSLDQHPDPTHFRQLLCLDPLCEVCNRTTAKISRLLSQVSLEESDDTPSHSASIASVTELSSFQLSDVPELLPGDVIPAPLPERFPPSPSALSPKQATPLADQRSPSPLGDSLPPEPIPPSESKFPVDHVPPQPPARPPPSPHHSQEAESVVQPEATSSPVESSRGLPAEGSAETGIEGTGLATPAFSWQPQAEDLSPPELAHTESPQELPVSPSSEASFRGDTTDNSAGPRGLSFLSPDVLTPLERGIKKQRDSPMWKEEEKEMGSFPKRLKPNYTLRSEGKRLESAADRQDSAASLPLGNSKGRMEEPHMQQPPDPNTSGDHLQQKYSQLFWGLPPPHGESLNRIVPASGDCFSAFVCFNAMSTTSIAHGSKPLPPDQPLSTPKTQPQPFPETLARSESQPLPPDRPLSTPEIHPQPLPKTLTPSESQPLPPDRPLSTPEIHPQPLPKTLTPSESQPLPPDRPLSTPEIHPQPLPKTLTPSESQPLPPDRPLSTPEIHPQPLPKTLTPSESQPLPPDRPLSTPEIHPQSLPETLAPSKSQALLPEQLQAPLEALPPTLPPSNLPQFGTCGVFFHGPQDETQSSLKPPELQDLEYNVSQKEQERVWGLPLVVQKSLEDACPPAPSTASTSPPSKTHAPVSILPGDYPLNDELRKKLEHHLRKRLIQHRWGLPRRIQESLSMMCPWTKTPESSKPQSSHGLSWISLFKHQSSEVINDCDLSQPRSFQERNSEMFPAAGQVKKEQRCSLETYPPRYLLWDRDRPPNNIIGSHSRKVLESHFRKLSGKYSRNCGIFPSQKQLENSLKVHLGKKCDEIHESPIPGTVDRARHSLKRPLSPPGKCPSRIAHRDLAPSLGKKSCRKASQDISCLGSSKQNILEDHINHFHMSMMCGLPPKVQKSIEIFNMEKTRSQASFHSTRPSSATLPSGVDSKLGVCRPRRRISQYYEDIVKTPYCVSILDCPFPATAPVRRKQERAPRQSHSDRKHEAAEDPLRMKEGTCRVLPQPHVVIVKTGENPSGSAYTCSLKLPPRQDGAGLEPAYKKLSSSSSVEMPEGKTKTCDNMTKPKKRSREKVKAEEHLARQSNPYSFLTSNKLESSPGSDRNISKGKTTLTTKYPPSRIIFPNDRVSSEFGSQFFDDSMFKLKNKKKPFKDHTKIRVAPPDNETPKTSLTPGEDTCSGNMTDAQVLCVQLDNTKIRVEQGQEPWVPKHDFHQGQDKNFPLAAKRMTPLEAKTDELGGGDAGLGTCQPTRKSYRPQEKILEETHRSKSSPTLTLKRQPPTKSFLLRNQMKHFLQWLCPSIKCKEQESSLEKGSSQSSAMQGRGLVKGRAASAGNTEVQKVTRDIQKVQGVKPGHRHGVEVACPQEPLTSPMRCRKPQQQAGLQGQAEPMQVPPFSPRASCSEPPSATFCSQDADLAGWGVPTRSRRVRDRDRKPPNDVAPKDQRHPPSVPHTGPVPHASPPCRHHVGQLPLAAPATAEGTVSGGFSLLLQEKILIQHFQGGRLPAPK